MKKPAKGTSDPLQQLSQTLSSAAQAFVELLKTWRLQPAVPADDSPSVVGRAAGRRADPKVAKRQASGQFPWEQIVKIAERLLSKDPGRSWRIGELAQAVKAAGCNVASATGMHFGLLPRLRELGLIRESPKGTFTAKEAGSIKPTTGPKAERPVAKRALPSPAKKAAFPWDTVIAAAKRLVKKDPSRRWSAGELCMAVKGAAGLESAKGLHLTLPARLKAEGLVTEKNGKLIACTTREKKVAAKKSAVSMPAVKAAKAKPTKLAKPHAAPRKAAAKKAPAKATKGEPVRVGGETPAVPPAEPVTAQGVPELDEKLIAACQNLLDMDPFKVWTGIDLVKAVKAAGLELPSWKGLHFSLPAILKKAKLVENEGKGFRSAVRKVPAEDEKSE